MGHCRTAERRGPAPFVFYRASRCSAANGHRREKFFSQRWVYVPKIVPIAPFLLPDASEGRSSTAGAAAAPSPHRRGWRAPERALTRWRPLPGCLVHSARQSVYKARSARYGHASTWPPPACWRADHLSAPAAQSGHQPICVHHSNAEWPVRVGLLGSLVLHACRNVCTRSTSFQPARTVSRSCAGEMKSKSLRSHSMHASRIVDLGIGHLCDFLELLERGQRRLP